MTAHSFVTHLLLAGKQISKYLLGFVLAPLSFDQTGLTGKMHTAHRSTSGTVPVAVGPIGSRALGNGAATAGAVLPLPASVYVMQHEVAGRCCLRSGCTEGGNNAQLPSSLKSHCTWDDHFT
jgi:hypothetical protein